MLFDTHAHLDDKQYNNDREEMINRAKDNRVELIVNVGYDIPSSQRSLELAKQFEFIYAAVGIHPHDAKAASPETYDQLRIMAQHPKVVAIGEIGLDYYYNLSPKDIQQAVFQTQLDLAAELGKPVIVHDRDAHGDIMSILKDNAAKLTGGVLHCFSGSYEMAKECIKLGFYISFAGPVTFKNAANLKEIVAKIPVERLLIETDAPYLTPEPYRGKRNESGYVLYVCKEIARLRNMDVEDLARHTMENGRRLFGI